MSAKKDDEWTAKELRSLANAAKKRGEISWITWAALANMKEKNPKLRIGRSSCNPT